MINKHKASETLRQMALTARNLSWLGAVAETVAELEEDNDRKDDAIAEQARQLAAWVETENAFSAQIDHYAKLLKQVKRERDAAKAEAEANRNELRVIVSLPNCNDCGHKVCMHKSPLGQRVRFNCPLWTAKGESQRGPCAENGGVKR